MVTINLPLFGTVTIAEPKKSRTPRSNPSLDMYAAQDRNVGPVSAHSTMPSTRARVKISGTRIYGNMPAEEAPPGTPQTFQSNNLHASAVQPGAGQDRIDAVSETTLLKQQLSSMEQSLHSTRSSNERLSAEHDQLQRRLAGRENEMRTLFATLNEEQRKAAAMQEASTRNEARLSEELRQCKQRLSTVEGLARAREGEAQGARRALEEERQKTAQEQAARMAREEALTQELLDTRKQLATAAGDLALVRTVAGDEGDAQGLVTMFEDVNDEISEFAFRLSRKLRTACRDTMVSLPHLQALHAATEQLFPFLQHFLEDARQKSHGVQDVLTPMAEAVVHWLLSFVIFDQFIPLRTLEDQRMSSDLLQMQRWIQSTEPQEYSARWRAVTYKAATKDRDDATLAPNIMNWVADYLRIAFCSFVDRTVVDQGIKDHETDLNTIVIKALRWQDRSRTKHYTYDYVPFLPLENSPFVDAEMEAEEEPSRPGKPVVLLPVSMGLRASRSETAAAGLVRVHKVLKKAQVLVA